MPTYTYHCKKCDSSVEHFHGINATPRIKCDDCGTTSKRMIGSGSGLIFKGTGFYETDYKTKTGKPDKKDSKGKGKATKDAKKPTSTKSTATN